MDGKLQFHGYFKIPAPQVDQENCVAHNGAVVPVPGRDLFVQAWYQGGITVIDFTDSSNPVEIAFFDRGPIDEEHLVVGGFWSAYWYDGYIYGTEMVRGLDVLALVPSEHLSKNEIAAAKLANQGERFNPQQQFAVTWPADPVVALAYLDQLERSGALPPATIAALVDALGRAGSQLERGVADERLADELRALKVDLVVEAGNAAALERRAALADTLDGIAGRLL